MRIYNKYTEELAVISWVKYRIDKRRERLLKKWGKTYYFKNQSISEKFEFEFFSLTPNDDNWHHMAITVLAWVKKDKEANKKKAQVSVMDNGVEVAKYNTGNPEAEQSIK